MSSQSDDRSQDREQAATTDTALTLFEEQANKHIRRAWVGDRWFFSVVDVIGYLTGTDRARKYWSDLKRKLSQEEGFSQLSAKIGQLKMRSSDGKFYTTDATDTETLFRIIQSIPSPRAEPIKQWIAKVAAERVAEEMQPSLAIERLRRMYIKKGYTDEWIHKRLESIGIRTITTAEWHGRGAMPGKEFAVLTDTLSKGTFDITTSEHKAFKGLSAQQNLQDSMTIMELALTSLADATAVTLHRTRDSQGFTELHRDAHDAGHVGGDARKLVEQATGEAVVSPINYKQLQQERQRQLQPPLFEESE